jgi:hypothetical protein
MDGGDLVKGRGLAWDMVRMRGWSDGRLEVRGRTVEAGRAW